MANINKPAIVVAAIVLAGTAAAVSAPIMSQIDAARNDLSAFGIKAGESVFGYQRQPAWREEVPRLFSVTPPDPDPNFREYAIQYDPDTNTICAVVAATESQAAVVDLKADLTARYGEPTATPANGWRWSKGAEYVEIQDVDTLNYVLWDFTGTCHDKNKALIPDAVTVHRYD